MATTTKDPVLFAEPAGPAAGAVLIHARCRVRECEGYRVVSVCGLPLAHFAAGDRVGEAYAMVSLVDLRWARQGERGGAGARLRRARLPRRPGGLESLTRDLGGQVWT